MELDEDSPGLYTLAYDDDGDPGSCDGHVTLSEGSEQVTHSTLMCFCGMCL